MAMKRSGMLRYLLLIMKKMSLVLADLLKLSHYKLQNADNMDQMAPAHFISGWLDTLAGVDFHDKITECFTPSEDLTQDVYYFMQLSSQAPQAAAQFWLKAIEAYKIALKNCDESILDANTKWT